MRVRVTAKSTSAYWNYSVQTWPEGTVLDGELARHLADNAKADVEVLDDDRKEARAAAAHAAEMAKQKPPPPGDDDSNTVQPGTGDSSDPANPEVPQTPPGLEGPADPDAPPMDGTADDLFKWIDGDPEKAGRALEAEQAKDKPRSTVVKRLSALAGTESE